MARRTESYSPSEGIAPINARRSSEIVMPDSSPAGLRAAGIQVGRVVLHPEPPYNLIAVSAEDGKRIEGPLQ